MNRSSPRVLLIGRRFWPMASFESTGFLGQLATDLRRYPIDVEVLTARHAASWPQRFRYREVLVHRPVAAPRSDWSIGRYTRHLCSWLKQHSGEFDVVMVDSMREEAFAVADASRITHSAVVLFSSGWADQSDAVWWSTTGSARRGASMIKNVDSIIVHDATSERLLLGQGIAPDVITRIPVGFANPASTADSSRTAARERLGEVNSDLRTMPDTPVIVCCGRMQRDRGMDVIARAAAPLVLRYPDLRFWFIGDGPFRHSLYNFLRGEGLGRAIAMPGSFVDLSDVLRAADVFVQADEQGLGFTLPAAVSACLPIVAIDSAAVRSVLGCNSQAQQTDTETVTWVSDVTPKSIRAAIQQVLDDLPKARHAAATLRRDCLRRRPQRDVIENYVRLIHSIGEAKCRNRCFENSRSRPNEPA